MPKADPNGLSKHTMHLFEGDYEKLARLHPTVPRAEIIRNLVRTYLNSDQPPFAHEKVDINVKL